MRIRWNRLYKGRLPILQIFGAGFILGILIMNFAKGVLLENTGLLDEYTLYHMKYMTVDSKALFVYSLGERLTVVTVIAVLSTTYLGLMVICAAAGWFGMLFGIFVSAAVLRYGMKGILLAATGIFPQYLLYIPAFICFMFWCEQLCREVCFRNSSGTAEASDRIILDKILRLLVILAAIFAGCFLESYLNPLLLSALLKIF